MDDDDEVIIEVSSSTVSAAADLEPPVSRPRSLSCVLLDSQPKSTSRGDAGGNEGDRGGDDDDDDDDGEEEEEEVQLVIKEMLQHVKSQELCEDDELRRVLEKDGDERTSEDTEILLEFMKHTTAFNNTCQSVKEALCKVMRFVCYGKSDWLVIDHNEELEDWFVIINGSVEVVKADGSIEILSVGQSFGICTNKEVTNQDGQIRTKENNCQFVCVSKQDFHCIFDKFEENKINVEDDARLVLVLERKVDEDHKDGYIVIQGSREKLMTQLLDSNMVDPTYIEDFLLTYRGFIDGPAEVTNALMKMFTDRSSREKVARILMLWINNHFEDFEENQQLTDFIDSFKGYLKLHKMHGHLKMLDVAHSTRSQPRLLTLARPRKDEDPPFTLIGGVDRGIKSLFISRVDKLSRLYAEGLRRGYQVLELNNKNCSEMTLKEAMKVIKSSTHLSIKVKANFYGFQEASTISRRGSNNKKGSPVDTLKVKSSLDGFHANEEDEDSLLGLDEVEKMEGTHRNFPRFLKGLFGNRRDSSGESSPSTKSDSLNIFGRKRSLALPTKLSTTSRKSSSSDPDVSNFFAHSMPTSMQFSVVFNQDFNAYKAPDAVLKVYRVDHTFKYISVHKETTCRDVVCLALKEFNCNDHQGSFSLCEVTFGPNNLTRTRMLAEHLNNLSTRLPVNARYYLKGVTTSHIPFTEEVIASVTRESTFTFLDLPFVELATQLTLRAFRALKVMRSSDHICDIFNRHRGILSKENLENFIKLTNEELFWVVTEVCSESNMIKRAKIIKHFIKTAQLCRTAQNYNSMFSILSGLRHGSVSRLKQTWEKVPPKYTRIFEDLQEDMDPSRNMAKYRNLLNSKQPDTPAIPFFPMFRKDLTFIHLGNDTEVNNLVNFEKMRMLAKEIRSFNKIIKGSYMTSNDIFKPFKDMLPSGTEGWRMKGLQYLPKKMYEEELLSKKARTYLESLNVIYDEGELDIMSQQCEPSMRYATLKKSSLQSCSTSDILSAGRQCNRLKKEKCPQSASIFHCQSTFHPLEPEHKNLQPLINRFLSPNKSKIKVVVRPPSENSDSKSISGCSDDQSSDAPESRQSANQSFENSMQIPPPPVTLPIILQPQGHPATRPHSHPSTGVHLVNKFPNFKPLPNSHQPYLKEEPTSSALSNHHKMFLESIKSPVGEALDENSAAIMKVMSTFGGVTNRMKDKRSMSSDRLLQSSRDYYNRDNHGNKEDDEFGIVSYY